MKHLLERILGRSAPAAAMADPAGVEEFLASRAAFVSQRATTEYCRARTGILWSKLMLERPFLDALEGCRWIAFAATAADIGLLIDGRLRRAVGPDPSQRDMLVTCFAGAVRRYPDPPVLAAGWQGEIDDFALRLDLARLAEPKPAHRLGVVAAGRIFESLPIHADLRAHDRELVRNHMRFAMVNVAEEIDRVLDAEKIMRAAAVA